jgi:hypothetical protein
MAKIMVRHANNDFEAMLTAQGMEEAGADVFSITHDGMHQPFGAMIPSSKFVVWAKVASDELFDEVDKAIAREFERRGI